MTRLLFLAIALCAAGVAAAQQRWATYANPRFGTTADYPADLFVQRDPPPANGDGQAFRTRDGRARLAVWGAYNVQDDTPQSYLQSYAPSGITYRQVTSRHFVVSGTHEGEIFYERCNFSAGRDGVINCFELTYPAADKAAMDRIVTRLSQSLRNGGK